MFEAAKSGEIILDGCTIDVCNPTGSCPCGATPHGHVEPIDEATSRGALPKAFSLGDARSSIVRLRELTATQIEALQAVAGYAYVGASRMGGGPQGNIPEHTADEQTCARCVAMSVFDRLDTGDLSHLVH
jgi:hypothetical protein